MYFQIIFISFIERICNICNDIICCVVGAFSMWQSAEELEHYKKSRPWIAPAPALCVHSLWALYIPSEKQQNKYDMTTYNFICDDIKI